MIAILAEKPDQARKLASPFPHKKHTSYIQIDPCSQFPKGAVVVWAIGHLVQLAEPEVYNPDWEKWNLNHLPIIPDSFKYQVIKSKSSHFKEVKKHLVAASEIIIATDPSRARGGAEVGRRKEYEGDLVSYRLDEKDLKLLDSYAKQLNSSRSKIVSYFIYEVLAKQKNDIQYLQRIVEETNLTKKQLTGNINLYVRKETKELIDQLRFQISEKTRKRLNRNIFVGAIVTYQLHQELKKNLQKGLTTDDLNPQQVAVYLNKSLYEKVSQHIKDHRLSFQLLLLDCLEDPNLDEGLPYFRGTPDDPEKEPEKYERVITLLPKYLYVKIKKLPVPLSFLASIQLQKHLDKYV